MTLGERLSRPAGVLFNTVLITGTNTVTRVVMLIFSILVVRLLGAGTYGEYMAAAAVAAVVQTVCESGLRVVGVRRMAMHPEDRGRLMVQIAAIWLLVAAIAIPVAVLTFHFFGYDRRVVRAIGILLLAMIPTLCWRAVTMLPDADQRFSYSAPTAFVIQAGGPMLGLVLALLGMGLYGLVLGPLVAAVAVLIYLWPVLMHRFSPGLHPRIEPASWWPLLLTSLPLGIQSWFLISNYRIDGLILLHLKGARQLGLYSAAYGLVFGLTAITTAVQTSLLPALSRMDPDGRERHRTLENVTRYGLAASVLVALGVFLLARPIIEVLYGGFAESAMALKILAWAVPCMLLSSSLWASHAAAGRNRHLAVAYGVLALFNLGANLVLIPRLGVNGAAIATVASEALIAAILYASAWSSRRAMLIELGYVARVVVSTAVAALIAHFVPWQNHLILRSLVIFPMAILLMILTGCLHPPHGGYVPAAMLRGFRRLVTETGPT